MASSQAETKSIIVGLLTSNPLRCTIRQLCDDFSNIVGYKIPVRQLGFNNVEDYLRSIPDTCQVFGTGPMAEVQGITKPNSAHIGAMVVKQKKTSIPAHKKKFIKTVQSPQQATRFSNDNRYSVLPPSTFNSYEEVRKSDNSDYLFTRQENTTRVPAHLQNQLCKLIRSFPNGIWCTDLPTEFYKMFKTHLRFDIYHYPSLIEMCADLPQIFNYVRPSSADFVVYHKNNQIPSLNQNDTVSNPSINDRGQDVLCKFSQLNWANGPDIIPSDIVPLGHVIPQYFPDDLAEGDHLDVAIGEIYSISNFFVYSYGCLASIMDDLRDFLQRQRNQYLIPELLLEEGLYCTVMAASTYHRCVIVDLLPKDPQHVRVLFIDYGSVGDIPNNEIWYLPRQFADVPCQAVKARLTHIQSTDELILNKFRDLIRNTILTAEIVSINKKEKSLDIYLADISDESNIFFINDILVEKGYAYYVDQKALSS